ncbi:MAG: 50S ribosomal protein L19e [Methanocalculus sp. MSAO_Arc1]|uniref:50S ribosomal protein L19e n=1 Tax=Methanocalculus TaxID=71151 RepID=UPI000FEFD610|nr:MULTISPECIES: 50S ribosomal protein L19e [unclassified Methanocalculus]MCP1662996.1 large subunit ribosomal protein L19e [Methanocalculus sp. AMF5]RQD80628.1 MAG: 50S ribosomal protein L19e [Methanocalculus sp. MSAO_Arc1]
MSNLGSQRRIAAAILKCGENRVWFDPEQITEIANAISRDDIRGLIEDGVITAHQKKGVSRGRARLRIAKRAYGHCKGHGRRKGAQGARTPSKRVWIKKIRAQRTVLREMRDSGAIERSVYRKMYRRAAGGQFRNVSHLKQNIEQQTGKVN